MIESRLSASRVYLLSCVSKKLDHPAPARELYQSALFEKSRGYVDARLGPRDQWFILSAKHHLLSPSDAIEPYEVTLNKMGARDRKLWAETVLDQLRPHLAGVDEVVFLAGERFGHDFLRARIRGVAVCKVDPGRCENRTGCRRDKTSARWI